MNLSDSDIVDRQYNNDSLGLVVNRSRSVSSLDSSDIVTKVPSIENSNVKPYKYL